MDRQTLESASDDIPPEREEAAREPPLYLRMLFVRMLTRWVIVPRVRVDIFGRVGGILAALHARGSAGGGLARLLLVAA
jgi:hypothetical protein